MRSLDFVLPVHSIASYTCNQTLAVGLHKVLTRQIFFSNAGLSAQCMNTSYGSEELLHHKMEDTLQEISTPFCRGTILLLCLFVHSIGHDAWRPRRGL